MGEQQQRDYDYFIACTEALVCALGHRDYHTQEHSLRVSGLSEEIGIACQLPRNELTYLKIGSRFHDIGKIGIPDEILLKPGRLDHDELTIMRSHSVKGHDILKRLVTKESQVVANIVRHHHEYFDGSGYPDKISSEHIPLSSRIIAVADSYDALTETRPYHKARTHLQALDIINDETGSKFDPYIVSKFETIIDSSKHRVA